MRSSNDSGDYIAENDGGDISPANQRLHQPVSPPHLFSAFQGGRTETTKQSYDSNASIAYYKQIQSNGAVQSDQGELVSEQGNSGRRPLNKTPIRSQLPLSSPVITTGSTTTSFPTNMEGETLVSFVNHIYNAEASGTPQLSTDDEVSSSSFLSAGSPCIRLQMHQLGLQLEISPLPAVNDLTDRSTTSNAGLRSTLSLSTPDSSPLPTTRATVTGHEGPITLGQVCTPLILTSPPRPQPKALSEQDVVNGLVSLLGTNHEGQDRTAFVDRLNVVLCSHNLRIYPSITRQDVASREEAAVPGIAIEDPKDCETDPETVLDSEKIIARTEEHGRRVPGSHRAQGHSSGNAEHSSGRCSTCEPINH
jgi:hypothetical protein